MSNKRREFLKMSGLAGMGLANLSTLANLATETSDAGLERIGRERHATLCGIGAWLETRLARST